MRKLTIALVAALTLSACGETPEQSQRAGEAILFATIAGAVVCGLAEAC